MEMPGVLFVLKRLRVCILDLNSTILTAGFLVFRSQSRRIQEQHLNISKTKLFVSKME
jgi:hypothetical protein